MGEQVSYTVADSVATVTINRPESMNSLNTTTKDELRDTLLHAAEDTSARVVVLTGTGRAFCVGQDLREHSERLATGDMAMTWSTVREHYNPMINAIATMPKPVVAAVNGMAAGAGASLAFACDFRVLSEDAGFNLAFSGVGLTADSGASWTLPRLVGHGRAVELLMLSETVPAARAEQLGLANLVVPAEEVLPAASRLAHRLAQGAPMAYAAIKQSLVYSASHSLAEALELESELQTRCGSTRDHHDAVTAFLAKRRPTFQGR